MLRRVDDLSPRRRADLRIDDLLHLALIASDNAAARVLARTSEGGTAAFVVRMNEMAGHLGLTNTHYADPSGLDPEQRVLGLRSLAPHRVCSSDDAAARSDHADRRVRRAHEPARRFRSTARTSCSARTSTCAPARPASSARPATAWRRCSRCRRAARSPSSCSAPPTARCDSGKRVICSTGSSAAVAGHRRRRSRASEVVRQVNQNLGARSGFERQYTGRWWTPVLTADAVRLRAAGLPAARRVCTC